MKSLFDTKFERILGKLDHNGRIRPVNRAISLLPPKEGHQMGAINRFDR